MISPKEMQMLTNDMCLNRKKLQQQQNRRRLVRSIVAATIRRWQSINFHRTKDQFFSAD